MAAKAKSDGEPMDMFTAVFNEHVNNAGRRTRAHMRKHCPSYLKRVMACSRKGGGIMAIFHRPPTTAYLRYARLVQTFVNEPSQAVTASRKTKRN